jgi:hypothetical protein
MENKSNFIFEAKQISNYLLPVPVRDSEKETYADAMQKLDIKFSKYEQALWKNMLKSKWRMACIDAGLALRKLFTMLAILEASPNYTSYFLSQNFSFFYVFKLFFVGLRAILRAIIGLIIVNSIQRKCS